MATASDIVGGGQLLVIGVVGYLAYKMYKRVSNTSVADVARAVDMRGDTSSLFGGLQSWVSDSVQKMEESIRNTTPPKTVQVKQYSFDANKWGDAPNSTSTAPRNTGGASGSW